MVPRLRMYEIVYFCFVLLLFLLYIKGIQKISYFAPVIAPNNFSCVMNML